MDPAPAAVGAARAPDPTAERYVSLATFRRDGREVRTPVWIAGIGNRAYVFTAADAGKVRRIRANGRARVAACDLRGRVRGAWHDARARIVTDAGTVERAYVALRAKYGWQMALTDLLSKLTGKYAKRAMVELEVTASGPGP